MPFGSFKKFEKIFKIQIFVAWNSLFFVFRCKISLIDFFSVFILSIFKNIFKKYVAEYYLGLMFD